MRQRWKKPGLLCQSGNWYALMVLMHDLRYWPGQIDILQRLVSEIDALLYQMKFTVCEPGGFGQNFYHQAD